jgi:hypothetical protein
VEIERPPKLKRTRSLSSKISKESCSLPRLRLRTSANAGEKAMGRVEVESIAGKNGSGEAVDYKAYLEEARYR